MRAHTRKGLARKEEIRLYEWLKERYAELHGKTMSEGAAIASEQLGLDISASTVVSMVHAMGVEPFWRVRPKVEAEAPATSIENLHDTLQLVLKLIRVIQATQAEHAAMLKQYENDIASIKINQSIDVQKLSEVCNNIVSRIVAIEEQTSV